MAARAHPPQAVHREQCLLRAGLVVESRVQHTAIVAGLVLADARLFFENGDGRARFPAKQFVRRGQAHDATAHDDDPFQFHADVCGRRGYWDWMR